MLVTPRGVSVFRWLSCAWILAAVVSATSGSTASVGQQSPGARALPAGETPAPQSVGRWTAKAAMPTPRLDAVAVENGGSIFLMGGIARSGGDEEKAPEVRVVERYDPVAGQWSKLKPAPLRPVAAASIGDRIFVLGRKVLYEFTPAKDEWRARAAMPTERQAFGVAAIGERVLVIGGATTDAQGTWRNSALVEEYDPRTDTWRTRAGMMTPRHQPAVAAVGNLVYVLGGAATYADDVDRDVDRVEVYDAARDRWSVGPRMPRSLAYFPAFAYGGRILTFPGSSPQVALQEYDPATLRWRLVDDSAPPTARWRYASAMAAGRVYLFGGVPRGEPADALAMTEEYGPQPPESRPR